MEEAAKSGMDATVLVLQRLPGGTAGAGLAALICLTLTAVLLRLQPLVAKRWSSSQKAAAAAVTAAEAVTEEDSSEHAQQPWCSEGFGPNWEVPHSLDWAPARRRTRAAYQRARGLQPHVLFSDRIPDATTEETYTKNGRTGQTIFSKSWFPRPPGTPPKAVVCYCHGYGDTCTFFIEGIARYLASKRYAVLALDYPGFGLSSGLHGYVPSFDALADAAAEHFAGARARPDLQGLPWFLFGQSMGGAVALKVHFKQPGAWAGAVLVAPMCKMADAVTPPWPVVQALKGLAVVLPKAKLVPNKDLAYLAFKDAEKRMKCRENVIAYKHRPRLRTALELLRATEEIERRLGEVSLPVLVLHGAADRVTDPSVSEALVERACSKDKKLVIYEDAWHSIVEGESDDAIFRVLDDVVTWLDERSGSLESD